MKYKDAYSSLSKSGDVCDAIMCLYVYGKRRGIVYDLGCDSIRLTHDGIFNEGRKITLKSHTFRKADK